MIMHNDNVVFCLENLETEEHVLIWFASTPFQVAIVRGRSKSSLHLT